MGSGFPLFFGFIVYCMLLMLALLLIVGIHNLSENNDGEYCKEEECLPDIKFSQYNKPADYNPHVNGGLNLAFVLVGLLSTIFMRKWALNTYNQCDKNVVSPADFTIMVQGLPITETADTIKEFFTQHGAVNGTTQVRKVVLAYSKIEEFIEENKELEKALLKKSKAGGSLKELEEEIEEKKKKIKELRGSYSFSGTAFVTFENEGGIFF
jgi:hypothetical protein